MKRVFGNDDTAFERELDTASLGSPYLVGRKSSRLPPSLTFVLPSGSPGGSITGCSDLDNRVHGQRGPQGKDRLEPPSPGGFCPERGHRCACGAGLSPSHPTQPDYPSRPEAREHPSVAGAIGPLAGEACRCGLSLCLVSAISLTSFGQISDHPGLSSVDP